MSLTEQINGDIKAAMLSKDKDKLESLRAIKSALLIANTSGDTIDSETEIKLLQKLVKQRKEAAEIYEKNGRTDLAQNELMQAAHIEVYLPKQMDTEEIRLVVKNIISSINASGIKDMGKVMGAATKQIAGKADNKIVSEIVKELLS